MVHAAARSFAVLLLVLLVAPSAWSAATGDSYMRVASGSMEPTYEVGDVLVVREAHGEELTQVGAVVVAVFGAAVGEEHRYAHRVDEVLDDGAWLRGDNNSERDPQPVTQDQVLGTPRLALTGVAADLFTASHTLVGRVVIGVVALVLLFVPSGRRPAAAGLAAATDRDGSEPRARAEARPGSRRDHRR